MGRGVSILGGMTNITHSLKVTAALTLLAFGLNMAGCSEPGPDDQTPVLVSVSTDYQSAVPGESITLVWRFTLAPDWHLYWVGRNDSGFPPAIDLELPDGWIAGGLQWPTPERHLSDGDILDHIYRDELVLLQKIGVPANAANSGLASIVARVEWLACKDSCVPGKTTVAFDIPLNIQHGDRLAAVADQLPKPLPEGLLQTSWSGQTFYVQGPSGTRLQFMPTVDCGDLVNLIRDGQGAELALRFQAKGQHRGQDKGKTVGPVHGLITVENEDGSIRAYIADFPAQLLSLPPSGG